jgi:hypothetical protein
MHKRLILKSRAKARGGPMMAGNGMSRKKNRQRNVAKPQLPIEVPRARNFARNESVPPTKSSTSFVLSILALIVSLISLGNSIYGTVQTGKIQRRHVRPDVQCVVRHSSLPENKDNPIIPELVLWNNGPIDAVAVEASYRAYAISTNSWEVIMSMGIEEDLLNASVVLPELKVGQRVGKTIMALGHLSIFVVNLTFHRDTDIEKFSRQEVFFYDGTFHDRAGFSSRTNYLTLMDALRRKMRAEEMVAITNIGNRQTAPAPLGMKKLFGNTITLGKDGRLTNMAQTLMFDGPLLQVQQSNDSVRAFER